MEGKTWAGAGESWTIFCVIGTRSLLDVRRDVQTRGVKSGQRDGCISRSYDFMGHKIQYKHGYKPDGVTGRAAGQKQA